MAGKINLDDYEPVEQRLMRFKTDWPDYRMSSELVSMDGPIGGTRWVVNVQIWKHKDDEAPAANGYAFEIDGAGMTQKAAALETCETSALGRALANLGYVGNRRVTREEMAKVQRFQEREEVDKLIESAKTVEDLRALWSRANTTQQTRITERVEALKGES